MTHLAIFGKTKITLNVISHNVSVFTVIPLYCVWWHTRNSYWFRPSEHNSVVGWNTRFESRYCLSADGSNPVSILLFSNYVHNLVPSWRSTPQCFFQFAHEGNSTCVGTQKSKWIFIFLNFSLKLEIFKFLLYLLLLFRKLPFSLLFYQLKPRQKFHLKSRQKSFHQPETRPKVSNERNFTTHFNAII